MINENDFFNVLKNIATQLKGINESLQKISASRNHETQQFVKESKQRMRNNKVLLTESQKRELEENVRKYLRESKLNPSITVNNSNKS